MQLHNEGLFSYKLVKAEALAFHFEKLKGKVLSNWDRAECHLNNK
jgi:hypothetical protein